MVAFLHQHTDMLELERYLPRLSLIVFVFIWLWLHTSVIAQIPLGSKLLVADNSHWISSNGNFALSFINVFNQPDQYGVGIQFNSKSIPLDQRTVVWVAGADVAVGNESYFQLSLDGELVLFDSFKEVPGWTSKTQNLSVVSATLNDNGNLVLLDGKQNIVWQSFDTPSDTLLPGQTFSVYKKLQAASKNSMSSYYTLYMNASGELQLRWQTHVIYWTSGTLSSSNLSAFLTSNGALQLKGQGFLPLWSAYGDDHNDSVQYRFLRLDVDGNLRLYSWMDTEQAWQSVWQAVGNSCKVFATCRQRGICVLTPTGTAECRCPLEATGENSPRCLVPYQHKCESGSNMLRFEHTFMYGFYPPDDSVTLTNLDQCEQLCLQDPLCTAATFENDGTAKCSLKKTNYVTGYLDPSLSSISFIKTCSGPLAVNPDSINSSAHSSSEHTSDFKASIPYLIGAGLGTLFVFIIVQLVIGLPIYRRRKQSSCKHSALSIAGMNSKELLVFCLSEIRNLTGNFKYKIGPKVFKGVLPNNHPVVVKELNASIDEREFRGAALKIGCIHHKHLAKLEGYCCEPNHKYLVYEYAKNGSLEKYVDDSTLCKKLTWKKRLEICRSIAKAMSHLHTGCREFTCHGNLKCENVVLDEDLEAKVTEFGVATIEGLDLKKYNDLPAEKDVEDFGKMMLLFLSGPSRDEEKELCEWAYKEWQIGRADNIVDRRIDHEVVDMEELERVLRIAFWCIQRDASTRPSMREVMKVMDGTLCVDPPPPFSFNWPKQCDVSHDVILEGVRCS